MVVTVSTDERNSEERGVKNFCFSAGDDKLSLRSQARAREEREGKRSHLDERHHHLFDILATRLGIERHEVEDSILDSPNFSLMDLFFIDGGNQYLVFFYQSDHSNTNDSYRPSLSPFLPRSVKLSRHTKPKVIIADLAEHSLRGVCLCFIRNSKKTPITIANIHTEVFFYTFECNADQPLLQALGRTISEIYLPYLQVSDTTWGKLGNENQLVKVDFLSKLSNFVSTLYSAQESINERVLLKPCDKIDISQLQNAADYVSVASNNEALQSIEDTMKIWIKQMEQVLAESEQIRREADNIGPRAELEYWKKRMTKFNFLLDQIKGTDVKAVLTILQTAKSKLIQQWKLLDGKITDAANEAKDNVRYLYTLEKFCEPLYNSDPVGMLDSIPGLINAVRMIHSISRYYNTSERMTSLFVKITNQMITTCKNYVTNNYTETIWSQDQSVLISKLRDCIKLNDEYQRNFQLTKTKLAQTPNDRPFDFSEMYIFGKFDSFQRRCEKIIDMFSTINMYQHLQDSKIEGSSAFYSKFNIIVLSMKKKDYDYLDQRKQDFDLDYDEFKRSIQDLHNGINEFLDKIFNAIRNTERSLTALKRFEKLQLPNIGLNEKYSKILNYYSKDLDTVAKIYQKSSKEPLISRDLPPIAGRIIWARQLYLRVQKPMNIFVANKTILQYPDAKKIIKNYNQLSKVLLSYEMLYHRGWLRQVSVISTGINSSLLVLVRHDNDFSSGSAISFTSTTQSLITSSTLSSSGKSPDYMINFDPNILELIRETQCLARLGLEIPKEAAVLAQREEILKKHYQDLTRLLEKNKTLREKIKPVFEPLLLPKLRKLNDIIKPGLTTLTWASLTIDDYVKTFDDALSEFDLLLERSNDLVTYRIDAVLDKIASMSLCELPEDEPILPEQFLKNTQELCGRCAQLMQTSSRNVEEAVLEVIDLLCSTGTDEELGGYTNGGNDDEETTDDDISIVNSRAHTGKSKTSLLNTASTTNSYKREPSAKLNGRLKSGIQQSEIKSGGRRKYESSEQLQTAIKELINYFSHKNLDAIVKVIKLTLEKLRKRITSTLTYGRNNHEAPVFKVFAELAIPNIVVQPPTDEVQLYLNKAVQTILSVAKNISQWSKDRTKSKRNRLETFDETQNVFVEIEPRTMARQMSLTNADVLEDDDLAFGGGRQSVLGVFKDGPGSNSLATQNQGRQHGELGSKVRLNDPQDQQLAVAPANSYYKNVSENKEIAKLVALLATCVNATKKDITVALEPFTHYSALWQKDRDEELKDFLSRQPHVGEFETKIKDYEQLSSEINSLAECISVGPLAIFTVHLKFGLITETRDWIIRYGQACNFKYRKEMNDVIQFIEDMEKRLQRPVKDLEDIRLIMLTVKELRENEIRIDMSVGPIEESYAMLQAHELNVAREETERCDNLRYSWQKLQQLCSQMTTNLLKLQPQFKKELLENVVKFVKDCNKFYAEYEKGGPTISGITPRESSDRQILFQSRVENLYKRYETYHGGEELFGLRVNEYPQLEKIKKDLALLQRLYTLYNKVLDTVASYYDIPWTDVDIDKINQELFDFQTSCQRLPKGLRDFPAFHALKKTIDEFSECCPLLEMMSNKAMQHRHWQRIADVTGVHHLDVEADDFRLRHVMDLPLLQFKEDIEDICIAAVKERDIEAKLKQVESDWKSQEFNFAQFKTRGELLLKGDRILEVIGLLEDSLMLLGSLMSNRYNVPFRKHIQRWVKDLTDTNEIIENWMRVQNLWVYLEAVFVGGDIAKQLPQEAKRFSSIDKSWLKIMSKAHEQPAVVQCCTADEALKQLLPHLLEQLELCQKSLTGYLERKRLLFPRFFFVSDPALLEILGQASDPHTIKAHLLSVFDNIKTVRFHDKEYDKILSIESSEGETIELEKPVKAEGNVEVWLMSLLKESQKSLHGVIRQAYNALSDSGSFNLIEFLNTYPAQVGLLGIQLIWTRDATNALKNAKSDKNLMRQTSKLFGDLLDLLIDQTTRDLSKVERTKYETLITIHVHQKDIFDELVAGSIRSISDFDWLKQTRFYFNEELDKVQISITDVDFTYQNEFLGCTERLVITPLTDRCYITLAQALHMSMGGAPAGPAGTGKTETVKDMGRCLGKYVVVFNCSDQMDFRGLGRIFKGLAQSGSFGCFDEFNRIDLPVLSVAAQQIAIILACKKEKKRQFTFTDGDMVEMNMEFGIFLTMNPGYAGRQELPENLKINFRSVAMMVPDRLPIIRVKMAACGFRENVPLSKKFYTLYKLCEEQLSKQVHYDFGLRNILSVLRTLGAVKRANKSDQEKTIVMRVLRDMNLSKLVDEDEPLFISLINDLFPNIRLEKEKYADLESAINKEAQAAGLISHPPWILKIIQLYETQRVRHGMMTLGPTGVGKTCCIHTLMKAMTICGEPHREMRMNPKAITAPQMFGRLDAATNDWTDGIFSTLWRRTLRTKKGEFIWLVLDGPVDAIWIENLNSVLDDNKSLTLANGDRISMAPNCKIIFEVHNIDNASPATVSRNGMVYMSSSGLDWKPLIQGWIKRDRSIHDGDILMRLFESSFPLLYRYFALYLKSKMPVLECMIVTQACKLLNGLLPAKDAKEQLNQLHIERLYVFAIMWSVGAFLELDDRGHLQEYILTNHDGLRLDTPAVQLNTEESIFDYFVNDKGQWTHWNTVVTEYVYPKDHDPEYSSILVPNVDNVRTDFLIHTIAKQNKPVLLIGEQGTAKTVIIQSYMDKYNAEEHAAKTVNFSSATTPNMVQRIIESYVDKRVGSTYGPPAGKKMTLFIDDINMPTINEWGDQITNEIVRQLIEQGGFYSLEKPGEFISIVDMQFLAAMIHPGGGRNDIPQRLKRQFAIFNCTLPSNTSIDKIFSVIGLGHYCKERGFTDEVRNLVERLVPATRRLWQLTKVKMLPTPAKFHYVFNLRDLSRIWQGMINTIPQVINKEKILIQLWKHECTRVICDRFVTEEDITWFKKTFKRVAEEELNVHYGEYTTSLAYFVDFLRFTGQDDYRWYFKTIDRVVGEELGEKYLPWVKPNDMFVDFLRDVPEPTGDEPEDADFEAPKIYEPIASFEQLEERLKMYISQYNESIRGSGMDLVFFKDAMTHLIKISRIIRTPRGNALLVGVGGSGKQSLTKLASFIAGYKTFQITLTRAYNTNNLLEDLKTLYRTAGKAGKGITFIFSDQDIKDESFLEYINNVLSSGVVPGMFARDEIDEICQELIPIMKKQYPRRAPTNENLYDYFLTRVRQNLHVVLCFSPVGEKFRKRGLQFPGLISGCTIDWFQRWPKDALVAVADHFLSSFYIVCSDANKKDLVQCMGAVHDGVAEYCLQYFQKYRRATHVTPKSYLSFINGYKEIYEQKLQEIESMAKRMNEGLTKLAEAEKAVHSMKEELTVKEKELDVANKKADEVLKEVAVTKNEAEIVKKKVQRVKDVAQALVDEINRDKLQANAELENARPALLEAEEALKTITPGDIAVVRRLGKPPNLIRRIMDCVLILFVRPLTNPIRFDKETESLEPSWESSLRFMSDTSFLAQLQTFPRDRINDEQIELLQTYFRAPDYTKDGANIAAGSIAGLLTWTRAMADFFYVNKRVMPLKANLAIQEARLVKANNQLQMAQGELDKREAEVAAAQAEYDSAMAIKQRLQDDLDRTLRRMNAATELILGLEDEQKRWTDQSKQFKAQIVKLVGDVLLCTGFLSYQGPFNQDFRLLLAKEWQKLLNERNIPFTRGLNVSEYLTDVTVVGEWKLQGLPNDELSIQNAIIVTRAKRYPLLIDPQGQGKAWIRNKEIANDLQSTNLQSKHFRQHLEDCLSLGRPLLIEDVGEELDPALDNVLEKNFIRSGSTLKVKVGDKEVDVLKGFNLYITTKLANPAFTPEISAKTSVIDFTVTIKGLEDQLLGLTILKEKSDLETERVKMLEDIQANNKRMKELEDNLLLRLTNSKGSLVDDDDLIKTLKTTKSTSSDVKQKLAIATETSQKINVAREEYRPVATRGSIVYFLIVEMSMVNVMYQTSLKQFLQLFNQALERSPKNPVTAKRITNILEFLTYEIYKYAVRGYYEEHKFMFTLLLALKIDQQSGKIKFDEFQTLVKGGASLDVQAVPQKPSNYKWLQSESWLNLVELSKLYQFSGILDAKDEPEKAELPDGYQTLDPFRRLLLVRSLTPSRFIPQANRYIEDSLGSKYVEGVVLDMERMWDESEKSSPLICFLSMGSDPTVQIETLAKKKMIDWHAISMGQGQEVHARRLLSQAYTNGSWVLLQNCHLSLDFCEEFLLQLTNNSDRIHPDFRLWITTELHPKFPIGLLQISIKYTAEPPQGVKPGLKRTFAGLTQEQQLESNSHEKWRPLLYAVAFLHTIVQERRKFGPLGWNIPYEFNTSDFNATVQFIQNHLDEIEVGKQLQWKTIHYMISEVQYGGRVTDDFDKRLLKTYVKCWFRDEMFESNFHFEDPKYRIPKMATMQDVFDYINELPAYDSGKVFGLSPLADARYQEDTTRKVLDTILSIQPKEARGGAGETREAVIYRLASETLEKLPPDYIAHEVKERLSKLEPMNIFLRQEIDRFQRVLNAVKWTLTDLKLAIDGTIVMNEDLRDALDRMYDAKIPRVWLKLSWESSTLGAWFSDLYQRNDQYRSWLKLDKEQRPLTYWMTGFFNPQGFLTAMRQEITRANASWSLDNVVLTNTVKKFDKDQVKDPPSQGVYVYGLYIEGAKIKNGALDELKVNEKMLTHPMPIIHISADAEGAQKDRRPVYYAPVYKKPRRTDRNYVCTLKLECPPGDKVPADIWTLRGVALLCDTK
ncbi:unnamed protein product [Didymodactylos carnosus]|uniref:AAA+ ATPase domain-containing protein n=1 Tax=Didymodactylos carnosus TaxID=1234261 RepID=A0A8S2GCV5_9BILA|nr:unnamed protein product [Didymodactylos carnosus]CAF3495555.1 unnamed protein product [Didymodactylos carnosus]